MLSEPVQGEIPFRPTGNAICKVACHEGNCGLETILAEARQFEQTSAKTHAGN